MSDSSPDEPPVDWRLTTFAGARREQLRRWSELSLRLATGAGDPPAPAGEPPGRGSGGD